MIDLNKPRYLVKDRLTGRVDKYGHEEKPCDYCYMKNGCAMNPSDCWELDMYLKLKSFELAIEFGELVPVVHGRWENRINECFRTCSNCEISMGMLDGESLERFCYCPFCGAKMDGKDGE